MKEGLPLRGPSAAPSRPSSASSRRKARAVPVARRWSASEMKSSPPCPGAGRSRRHVLWRPGGRGLPPGRRHHRRCVGDNLDLIARELCEGEAYGDPPPSCPRSRGSRPWRVRPRYSEACRGLGRGARPSRDTSGARRAPTSPLRVPVRCSRHKTSGCGLRREAVGTTARGSRFMGLVDGDIDAERADRDFRCLCL